MPQECIVGLSMISIEKELCNNLDMTILIYFSFIKVWKVNF